MTAVLVEDRDGENLRVDAISGGSCHDGRKPLDSAELRNRGGGCLEGLERSLEKATVSRLERGGPRLTVKRLLRLARSQCAWCRRLPHIARIKRLLPPVKQKLTCF
jgi:hypothetical protein